MTQKKQILVDMDGVLADVYPHFQEYEKNETGHYIPAGQLIGVLELEAFPNGRKHVMQPGFFRTVPIMEDSREGLKYLNDKYNVLIVSSATEFPNSLTEKIEWLNENFPFISWKQIILCGQKDSIKGDIMIDDHLKNLDPFDGQTILFTQPHNQLNHSPQHKRMNSWKEVFTLL